MVAIDQREICWFRNGSIFLIVFVFANNWIYSMGMGNHVIALTELI